MTEQAQGPDRGGAGRLIASVEQLVAAREQREMSQGEVAQRLKLNPRQLAALERGDWEALPGRAFVRGCVRAYARLLDVDATPLLESIGAVPGAEALRASAALEPVVPRTKHGRSVEGKTGRWRWVLLGVVGVVLMVIVARWWESRGRPPLAPVAAPTRELPPVTAPAAAAPDGAQPLFALESSAPARVHGPEVGVVPPAVPVSPAPLLPPPSASAVAPEPEGVPSQVPVRITVTQEAWVEVRQVDGKTLFMGPVKPDQPLEMRGPAPLSLTVGNAEAVTLEAAGHIVDLRPFVSAADHTARVRVP